MPSFFLWQMGLIEVLLDNEAANGTSKPVPYRLWSAEITGDLGRTDFGTS
ncbi:MAG: hypothetical protein II359_01315 [Clostridia bacterium]|nr:hypothetical protein [Clostridia bacterium]